MADTYKVDETDPRLKGITQEENKAIANSDALYDEAIKNSDAHFDKQIYAVKDWEGTQTKLQNKQTDFAIDQIEQQKGQAKQDYIKEQSGAYTDWQKQSNQYGANAEAMAAQGMGKTGYSESSQVSMYNTYQNRVATARESYNRAVLNYNNAITEARLANSSALAQIAYESLQKQLELSLAGFQYKNTLLVEMANARRAISQDYWSRYNAMWGNIHNENVLNEQVRQHNKEIKLAQDAQKLEWEKFNWTKDQARKASASSSSTGSSTGGSTGGGKINKSTTKNEKGTGGIKPQSTGTKLTGQTNNENKGKDDKREIDMDSVMALGFGPISASRLYELEKQGIVESYRSGNDKIKFRLTAKALKQSKLAMQR